MKKGKIKNILRTLMLSLIVIIPSLVFATTEYEKGDIKDTTHSTNTSSNCTISGNGCNPGDVAFEKTVSKTDEKGIYEISLKVKGKDVTKTVQGNTHDIYIAVVLDVSNSMGYAENKYENAIAGAKYFANKVLEKNENAQLALLTFAGSVTKTRDFDNEDFDNVTFPKLQDYTNLQAGISEAHKLLKAKKTSAGNEELYMVVIGDGEPTLGEYWDWTKPNGTKSIENANAAKNDDIEIFSIGYELGTEGTNILKKVAGFKENDNIYNAYDDLKAKENFVEAKVDTILRKFDKIANKVTKTFNAGTDVTIKDVIGESFTYVEDSAKLEYTYNGKDYSSSITPDIDGKELSFELDEIMEIVQTIKFKVQIDENTLEEWNKTNISADIIYTDSDGNTNQSLIIDNSSKVYWTQPKYIINYYKDSKNDSNFLGKVEEPSLVGNVITADITKYLPIGYKYEGAAPSMTIKENGNELDVIYVKDLSQKKELNYTVKYYKDNVEVEEDKIEVTEEVWIGENDYITVQSFDKSNDRYEGYKFKNTDPASVSTSVESGTVIGVYYVKDITQTKELKYTVEYYKDNGLAESKDYKQVVWVNDDNNVDVDGANINTTNKFYGYKFKNSNPAEIPSDIATGSTIKIYYVKDDTVTKELNYTVKYFTINNGVKTERDSYTVTEEVWVHDSDYITVQAIDKSNNKYTGYKYGYTDPEVITTSVNTGTVIKVYYVKDENQTKDVNYTVKYYKDNVEVIEDRIEVTKKVWTNDEDKITVDSFDKSNNKYVGYKYDHTDPTSIPVSIESGSIIKVYYVKDENQTKDVNYTVKYYKDNIEVTEDKVVVTKKVWINADNVISVDEIDKSNNKYVGYKYDHTDPTSIPSSVESGSTIKVYYVKDNTQTKEVNYTVKYYKDNIEVIGDRIEVTKNIWINDLNMITVDSFDTSDYRYVGYKFDSMNPENIGTSVISGTEIKVYYVKDLSQTKDLTYTVRYFIDEEEVIEDRINVTKKVWINADNMISVDEIDISNDRYVGYKFDYTTPEEIPSTIESRSIIDVYYVKDLEQTKELTYTVKYFKDEVEVEEDKIVVTKEVWINDSDMIEIEEFDSSDDKYTGYSFSHINPEDLGDTIKTESIIEVHYVINYYNYTVNYYKDSISEENLIDSIENEAKYQEVIEIDELLNLPKGYTYNGEDVELIIDVENNIVNIVYEKKSFEYIVEYYYDGKLDEEKTDVISALYGTEITEVEDKSYDNYLLSKIENLPLVIDTEDNIIKVYYVESGIGGDIIEPPKTGNNSYLNILLVLISLLIIKLK